MNGRPHPGNHQHVKKEGFPEYRVEATSVHSKQISDYRVGLLTGFCRENSSVETTIRSKVF
jgi:hypothetical protein